MSKINSVLLAVSLVFATAITPPAQAQLGGLAKGLTGTVTADSLNGDLFGGLDFFAKANEHFLLALIPAEKNQPIIAKLQSLDKEIRLQATKQSTDILEKRAKELLAEGKALNEDAKAEIAKGHKEMAKGITKWATVGTALGLAASKGGGDTALVAAIPVASEMIKDLPALKRMGDAINKLKPLMKK